jgi:hypothetical protein
VKIFVTPRKAGKTHRLIEWVKQGSKTSQYPGWTRIILVHSLREAERLRGSHSPYGLDYRQVFSVEEYRNKARFGHQPIEIGVDNIEIILSSFLGGYDQLKVGTLNGENW